MSPDYDEDVLELAPDVWDERQGPRLLGAGTDLNYIDTGKFMGKYHNIQLVGTVSFNGGGGMSFATAVTHGCNAIVFQYY